MKLRIILLAAVCASGFAKAQITLTPANNFVAGDRFVHGSTYQNLSPAVVQGNAGAAQTWNFSTTTYDALDTLNIALPGWLPPQYSAGFPSAQLLAYSGVGYGTYSILESTSYGVYVTGASMDNPPFGVSNLVYQDPMLWMHWPMTYGQTVNDTAIADWLTPTTGPSDSLHQIMTSTYTLSADAWGTLNTAFGTYNVLRITRTEHGVVSISQHDSISGWSSPQVFTYDTRTYEWWTDMAGVGYFIASIQVDYITDTVVNYSILQSHNTGIPEDDHVSGTFSFYPNPAGTNITITAKENSRWEIVDLNGEVVRYGFAENSTTQVDISDLPVGLYFVNVADADGVRHCRKLIVE